MQVWGTLSTCQRENQIKKWAGAQVSAAWSITRKLSRRAPNRVARNFPIGDNLTAILK